MKIKSDFVTNSSSTSFIIGQLKKGELKAKTTIEVDLSRYVQEELHTMKDLKHFIDDYWGGDKDEKAAEMEAIIKNGGIVYILNVGTEDYADPIEPMLCNNGLDILNLPDNIVVIRGEGGY